MWWKKDQRETTFTRDCDDESTVLKWKSLKTPYKYQYSAQLDCFNPKRVEGIPISAWHMFRKSEIFFHRTLGLEGDFKASFGCLTRFKQCYGIQHLNFEGECLKCRYCCRIVLYEISRIYWRKKYDSWPNLSYQWDRFVLEMYFNKNTCFTGRKVSSRPQIVEKVHYHHALQKCFKWL